MTSVDNITELAATYGFSYILRGSSVVVLAKTVNPYRIALKVRDGIISEIILFGRIEDGVAYPPVMDRWDPGSLQLTSDSLHKIDIFVTILGYMPDLDAFLKGSRKCLVDTRIAQL